MGSPDRSREYVGPVRIGPGWKSPRREEPTVEPVVPVEPISPVIPPAEIIPDPTLRPVETAGIQRAIVLSVRHARHVHREPGRYFVKSSY